MSFTDKQRRRLTAKLKHQHVKTRSTQGGTISYVEGWHVIAEANRIFGHDCWDRKTLSPRCVWSHHQTDQSAVFYTTKVCITVRADGDVIVREGIGTGFARAPSAEAAHDIALKAAETDATKRALATFGNPFGLALYDKGQAGVTKPPRTASIKKPTFALRRNENTEVLFNSPSAFMEAVLTTIRSHRRHYRSLRFLGSQPQFLDGAHACAERAQQDGAGRHHRCCTQGPCAGVGRRSHGEAGGIGISKRDTRPEQGASEIRSATSLLNLRTAADTRPPRALCSDAGTRHESQRRIHGATVLGASRCRPPHGQREELVDEPGDRSSEGCCSTLGSNTNRAQAKRRRARRRGRASSVRAGSTTRGMQATQPR